MNNKKLIIVGIGEIAEMAMEYFQDDSDYEVFGFAAERKYLASHGNFNMLCDLPIFFLEDFNEKFPPSEYCLFVALGYDKLNHGRAKIYTRLKKLGYDFASYVSSRCFLGRNTYIGENCFILENNVIQRDVEIGNNVFLWSGNHIGHKTKICDHVFLSSHVAVSGYCVIKEYCFLGINSCLADHVIVEKNCFIGAGVTLSDDTEPGKIYRSKKISSERLTSNLVFGF